MPTTHPAVTLAKKITRWVTWKRLGVHAALAVAGLLPGAGPVASTVLRHLAEADALSSAASSIARRKEPDT